MARRGLALLLLVPLFLIVLLTPGAVRADAPGAHTVPVAVLALDTEDADEQADAMTGALRSRVRAASGWSLVETTQSLGMMTAALKCPPRPPPECQNKISELLKSPRYLWGFVSKGPGPGQVTAEIHLYQRGRPDAAHKETYADNLKDANDDTLRKIAARLVERFGEATLGVVQVRAPEQTAEAVVDGEKHVPLDKGMARIELAAGSHSIEVMPAGGPPIKRNIVIAAGHTIAIELMPPPVVEPPSTDRGTMRRVIGGVAMGVGAGLGVVAVLQGFRYGDLQDEGEARAASLRTTDPAPCRNYDQRCSDIDQKSKVASGLAIGLGGASLVAITVGAILLFTDIGMDKTPARGGTTKPTAHVTPSVGATGGSLTVGGTF